MSEYFTTSLADILAIALFLNDLLLCYLCLFVNLANVAATDWTSDSDFFALLSGCFLHRCIRRIESLITLHWQIDDFFLFNILVSVPLR